MTALSNMIAALALEVDAIGQGGTTLQLRGGERIEKVEERWLYRFPLSEERNFCDDTPVRLACGNQETTGNVVSLREGVLLVAVEADCGPRISFARLVVKDSFLVDRLKQRLEDIHARRVQFNVDAANRVIGEAAVRTANLDPDGIALEWPMNPEQRAAIRRAFGSDTTFLWGPPGTGKTKTLARIVEAHYRAGRSVLLVSNTNIAVDTALEQVAIRLEGEADFHGGLVLRQGPIVKEELRKRFGTRIIPDEIVGRLGAGLRGEKENLQKQIAVLNGEAQSLEQAVSDHQRFDQVSREIGEVEVSLAVVRNKKVDRETEAEQARAHASAMRAKLDRSRTMGRLRRWLAGLDPDVLEREIASKGRNAQAAADAARALAEQITGREARVRELRQVVEILAAQIGGYPVLSGCNEQLQSLRENVRQAIASGL